jgi:hypothetical protein
MLAWFLDSVATWPWSPSQFLPVYRWQKWLCHTRRILWGVIHKYSVVFWVALLIQLALNKCYHANIILVLNIQPHVVQFRILRENPRSEHHAGNVRHPRKRAQTVQEEARPTRATWAAGLLPGRVTSSYLHDGGVLGQGALRFRRLTDSEVFNVTATEYDVLEHFIPRWDRAVCWSVLCTKRPNWWESRNHAWDAGLVVTVFK